MKPALRKYLAAIGARGGRAGKGSAKRREICKRAAQIRWAKRAVQKGDDE